MPWPFRRLRTIRAHLLGLVVVTVVPLLWLIIYSSHREYELALEQGEARAYNLADATTTSARAFMSVVRGSMEDEASLKAQAFLDPARCAAQAVHFNDALAFAPNVLVVGVDGRVICSSHPPRSTDSLRVEDRRWFDEIVSGADFGVGVPAVGRISRTWVLGVAVPLRRDDGTTAGALALSLPLLTFQNLLGGVSIGPDGLVTIADFDRVVLARSRDSETWVGHILPPQGDGADRTRPGYTVFDAPDGEGVARTWAAVEVPELRWRIYGGIPTEDIVGPARAKLLRRLALSALVLVLVGLLTYVIQRRISNSLKHLILATESEGDGPRVSMPANAPAEVAAVAEHFEAAMRARVRAEREERRAKERYRSIVDNAVLGIYVSTDDGSFLEVNPAFAALVGYDDPAELLAVGPEALYASREHRAALVEVYRNRDVIDGIELEWVRRDGSPLVVRLYGKIVAIAGGHRAFEVMVEDITERRLLEEQLRTTQKMEAVGRLAGGLAHDFNNVLTVIRMNAELARSDIEAGDSGLSAVQEIVHAADGAQRLTRQLLSFSRKGERPDPQVIQPNELVSSVEAILTRALGEDVTLELRLDPSAPCVRIDTAQLEQILLNLAINARDALPEGGRIVISTRAEAAPADAQGEGEGVPWLLLTVEDDGTGMDETVKMRVFEPFFTTKDAGQGTGLGLATAYAAITAADGQIALESTPGQGTRVEIRLPGTREEPTPAERTATEISLSTGQETVLLVEDNDAVRKAVRRTLEGAGYHVMVARDGREGLDVLQAPGTDLDLVLTDVVMPNVSGPELADHVDRMRPGTPILFMSGHTADHPMAERVAHSHVDFIAKPFEIGELLLRVRKALERGASRGAGTDPGGTASAD